VTCPPPLAAVALSGTELSFQTSGDLARLRKGLWAAGVNL